MEKTLPETNYNSKTRERTDRNAPRSRNPSLSDLRCVRFLSRVHEIGIARREKEIYRGGGGPPQRLYLQN